MKIFELLRNPIVKTVGVIAILYFALFSNRDNPESLGNRWAPQQLKQDFKEAREKGHFIVSNVQAAKEAVKAQEPQTKLPPENLHISVEDLEEGQGTEKISCGNEVEISYGIYNNDNKQIIFAPSEKFTIGSKQNELIEKNLVGLKQGAIRTIKIPQQYKIDDKKISDMQKFQSSDLKYQITILNFSKTINPKIICEESINIENPVSQISQ